MTTQTHKWLPNKPVKDITDMIKAYLGCDDTDAAIIYKQLWILAPEVEQETIEMTDGILESIEESARESYRRYKTSVRGQIISRLDDYEYHVILATIKQFKSKAGN
jgi:hypothetical protein